MHRSSARALAGLALFAASLMSSHASAAPPAASAEKVRVTRIDAEPVEGAFVGIDAKEVRLEGVAGPIPVAVVREIRFGVDAAPRPLPEGSVGLRVVLRGGDVVRGALESATADELTIRPPDLASMKLPFDVIRCVESEAPDRRPCDEPARQFPARKGTDVAYAKSGDAFAGTVAEATLKGVVLESGAQKRSLAWADLVVLHLDGKEPAAREGAVTEIETAGGSLLLATDAVGDPRGFTLTLAAGPKVVVPRDALVVVRRSGGAFTRLETLPFTATLSTQNEGDVQRYLESYWGARVDRTQGGCPLRIAGTTYRHGIAVYAKSTITVALGGRWTSFSATFGIDDEVLAWRTDDGAHGDVTARVLVDGKEAWSSKGSVKGGEPPRKVGPIDLTGATTLVLEVDAGENLGRLDRADWADPILVEAR